MKLLKKLGLPAAAIAAVGALSTDEGQELLKALLKFIEGML